MEVQSSEVKLKNWLQRLGYNGPIPDSLNHICNSSTSFIWDQLIENAHPKEYADHIKNNIIINRMSLLKDQEEFSYPIDKIDVYNRKMYLLDKKSSLEKRLAEKKTTLDKLKINNNITYLSIQKKKEKIQRNSEQEFILKSKTLSIENELAEAEENLAIAKQLTPTEMDENVDSGTVQTILEECAEKLNNLLPKVKPNHLNTTKYSICDKYLTPLKKNCLETPKPKPNRESLGILPDHCMAEVEFSLVLTDDTTYFNQKMDFDSPSKFLDYILENKQLSVKFRQLLANYNRNFLWCLCSSMQDKLLCQLYNEFTTNKAKISRLEPKREDLMKSYAEHVQLEIKAALLEKRVAKFAMAIGHVKNQIARNLDQKQLSNLMILAENAGLSSSFEYVQTEMNNFLKHDKTNRLDIILNRLSTVQQKIETSVIEIENHIDSIHKVLSLMQNNKEETVNNVHRLNTLFKNLTWMNVLLEHVNVQEVGVLTQFPLQHKLLTESHIDYSVFTSEELVLIASILQNPFNLPEKMFADLFVDKLKERQLSRVLNVPLNWDEEKKFDLLELTAKEDYVRLMLDRISKIQHSRENNRILDLPKDIEMIKNIWMEQPFKRYISENYLVNGFNLKYYEQQFDHFYNL